MKQANERGMSMQIQPILAALRRHKAASLLIVLQIALTLAVVSNALFIVKTRIVHLSRPTGTDEAHLFVIRNDWPRRQQAVQVDAQMRADLATLRSVPDVRDAFASQAYPLEGGWGRLELIKHTADQIARPQLAISYFVDEHALATLGVALVAGRNFRADEVVRLDPRDTPRPAVVIITRDLAGKLFPGGSAIGRTIYLGAGEPSTIIGVVDRLEGAYVGSTTRSIDEDTMLLPARLASPDGTIYLVRTQPGALAEVMHAAPAALLARDRLRVIDPDRGVISLAQARARGYATDRGVAIMMGVICVLMLLATAGGIVGLSSFWVGQRRRSIGIRRALGASRCHILRYFQVENFLIVSGGIMLGAVLAVLANLQLMTCYELPRLPPGMLLIGAMLLWLLGQLAVLGPARRAAAVPPAEATRSV